MSSDKILQPLPLEKWPKLGETLKKDWPSNAYYYNWMQNSINWKSKEPTLQITIYCPEGDENSGIFVGVSTFSFFHVVAFAHVGFEEFLYKAVTETKIINWSDTIYFMCIHSRLIPTISKIVETLKNTNGKRKSLDIPLNYFFKSKEECAAVNICVPDDCYLKILEESHVPLIHSLWPFRDEENPEITLKYLMTVVRLNKGIGLFSKDNNELLSWILHTEMGGLGVLQTVENCKRKGYAKVVINALAKDLAMKGVDPTLFVVQGNIPSEKLFTSLNWKVINPIVEIILR